MQIESHPLLALIRKMAARHKFQLESERDSWMDQEDILTSTRNELEEEIRLSELLLNQAETELTTIKH
jgi:hypothetical protein